MFETLGLFPDLTHKDKSLFVSNEVFFPQKNMNKSIVFANGCGSPHSLKTKRNSLFQATQQVFGIKSYRHTLEKKLE